MFSAVFSSTVDCRQISYLRQPADSSSAGGGGRLSHAPYVLYEAAARRAVYDLMPLPDVPHIQHPLITIITLISDCKLNNNDRRCDIKTSYNWPRNRIVVLPCPPATASYFSLQCAIRTDNTTAWRYWLDQAIIILITNTSHMRECYE